MDTCQNRGQDKDLVGYNNVSLYAFEHRQTIIKEPSNSAIFDDVTVAHNESITLLKVSCSCRRHAMKSHNTHITSYACVDDTSNRFCAIVFYNKENFC